MADVLSFPSMLSRVAREERIDKLRDIHDGFRAVGDVCVAAARHKEELPLDFLDELYRILSREAEAAERTIAQ